MAAYEYQVIPAPVRGEKAKGLKTTGERFANTLAAVLNDMAAQGWEYLRAETLPAEERSGLTGRNTAWQNLLIFRRALAGNDAATAKPALAAAPAPAPTAVPAATAAPAAPASATTAPATAAPAAAQTGTIPPAPRPMPDPKPAPRPAGNTPFSGRMPQPPLKPGDSGKP